MAIFDDTTTLSAVSRRTLLAGAAASPLIPIAGSPDPIPPVIPDPILPLWHAWRRQHSHAVALCARWQDLETHLMRTIGVPRVQIPSTDRPDGTWTQSHAEIDRAFEHDVGAAHALHADLTAQQARWNAVATSVGFDALKQEEIAAWQEEVRLSHALFGTRATSLAGIEAKLALITSLATFGSDDPEFPWPQLRSTLADLRRYNRENHTARC